MTKKTKKEELTAAEELLQAEETGQETGKKKAEIAEIKAEPESPPEDSGTYVYCGPSVRGVARQYTVFNGGIPDYVKDFAEKHPIAKAMIVPLERFAEMRSKLETKGTAEALLYGKLKSEL